MRIHAPAVPSSDRPGSGRHRRARLARLPAVLASAIVPGALGLVAAPATLGRLSVLVATTVPALVAPAVPALVAPAVPAVLAAAWPALAEGADRRPGQTTNRNRPQQERVQQTLPIDEAQAALRAGQPARAIEITEQALKAQPTDAPLRFTRGLALVDLRRSEEAEAVFRGLTQEFPEIPEPYNNLAFVLAARGDLDGARMALEQALAALPGYAIAHENLGDIHVRLAARHFRDASRMAAGSNRAVAESAAAKLKLIQQFDPAITATRGTP